MAFDGIVISNLVYELNRTILGQKISKIAQPEVDELLLTTKGNNGQYRIQISASASLPFVYLTDSNKPAPLTAPTFCMVLRKHIADGKIIAIDQPGNERIIRFTVEHLDEMGDLCQKYLIVELMGKHSNIIFCSDNYILDINMKYLQHDYFTDIITFDYCEKNTLSGDLFISVDSVRENALLYGAPSFEDELNRVIVHGLLHLIGYDDHSDEQVAVMRQKENYYLELRKSLQ